MAGERKLVKKTLFFIIFNYSMFIVEYVPCTPLLAFSRGKKMAWECFMASIGKLIL